MDYPSHLLPGETYEIIDFDVINKSFRYLTRRTEYPIESGGILKDESIALSSNHLRDYSTNLLGAFQIKDLEWKLNEVECLSSWQPGMSGVYPTSEQASQSEVIGRFFLNISRIHLYSFKPKNEYDKVDEVVCKVIHTPVCSNFWHCSLRWYCDDESSEQWNKGRLNRMKADIRSFIRTNAEFEEPIYQSVDPIYYTTA